MHKENVLSELSVVDISTLVNLIKENKTTTIKGLCLEFLYPDLYRKLDKAYFKKAYSPMVIHRLMKDFQNDSIEYNIYF